MVVFIASVVLLLSGLAVISVVGAVVGLVFAVITAILSAVFA